jgi:CHAT domain-containing protein
LVDWKFDKNTNKNVLKETNFGQLSIDMEYKELLRTLKNTQKEFKIQKSAINFESLKEMIAKKPKIIHISCHGDYDESSNEFYLQFENGPNGIGDKFTESRLLELLGTETDHGIKLAFVSACHSEKIGKILFKCKIPIVIAVNSHSTILDDICLLFSRHLYMQLL